MIQSRAKGEVFLTLRHHKEGAMVKYTMSINTTHTFGESELATVAYALGKSDREPQHVTEEELGEFILDALLRRIREVNRHAESV